MNDKLKKYLSDIIFCIDRIDKFIGSEKIFSVYTNDEKLKLAVERNIEIIGEAMNHILKMKPDVEITNARKIVNARNLLIHSYDDIDDASIWSIVINHLPLLKTEVQKLIDK